MIHRLSERYPVALEEDLSGVFLGLSLQTYESGLAFSPSITLPTPYVGPPQRQHFMHFSSFSPPSVKRSLVLGLVARIHRQTVPLQARPEVLTLHLRVLMETAGFPIGVIRRTLRAHRGPWRSWVLPVLGL